jgi:N-acetyl sugar amidotransferase
MIKSINDIGFQQCKLSVMDNIADPNITFDQNGICNYYYEYLNAAEKNIFTGEKGKLKLKEIADQIKSQTKGKQYDCIVGLSGGADSTYLALLAKEIGLNPLLVHFDYGWNSELAVKNIESTVSKLGLDLYTYVMDWEEFKDLQRAYFKASVLDLDVPADHMIFGALFKVASKYKIKHILSGNNVATEHTLPKAWNYNKFDLVNLKSIHKKFGEGKLKKLPKLGLWHYAFYQLFNGINTYNPLNYVDYNKDQIKLVIKDKLDWKDYGGKHHESVFTRFYQGYILPNKFGIDKRKAHLSNLIFAGQISKKEALDELNNPAYDLNLQKSDLVYVGKKLGFTSDEFAQILSLPNKSHLDFETDLNQRKIYFSLMKSIQPITKILKSFKGIK